MGIAFFVKWTIRSPFIINYIPILFVFIKVLKNEKNHNKKRIFLFFNEILFKFRCEWECEWELEWELPRFLDQLLISERILC